MSKCLFQFMPALLPLLLWGCATQPDVRVTDVMVTRHTRKTERWESDFLSRDRASGCEVARSRLTGDREEILVRWSGEAISRVRLEYRQLRRPYLVRQQDHAPTRLNWHGFAGGGDECAAGGVITAWRVTLWQQERLVAEKRSALW